MEDKFLAIYEYLEEAVCNDEMDEDTAVEILETAYEKYMSDDEDDEYTVEDALDDIEDYLFEAKKPSSEPQTTNNPEKLKDELAEKRKKMIKTVAVIIALIAVAKRIKRKRKEGVTGDKRDAIISEMDDIIIEMVKLKDDMNKTAKDAKDTIDKYNSLSDKKDKYGNFTSDAISLIGELSDKVKRSNVILQESDKNVKKWDALFAKLGEQDKIVMGRKSGTIINARREMRNAKAKIHTAKIY